MDRNQCCMCHFLDGDKYCDYYDVFFMKCINVDVCPDGLDDDDEYDDDEYY